MTIDKSLRRRGRSAGARSVLTRDERILQLKETERWKDGDAVTGLPKVRVYKIVLKKKKVKKEEGADAKDAKGKPAKGPAKK